MCEIAVLVLVMDCANGDEYRHVWWIEIINNVDTKAWPSWTTNFFLFGSFCRIYLLSTISIANSGSQVSMHSMVRSKFYESNMTVANGGCMHHVSWFSPFEFLDPLLKMATISINFVGVHVFKILLEWPFIFMKLDIVLKITMALKSSPL